MEVDVAVIGAGPAGSTVASLLARRGAGVALIDSDTFPRDKVCGEFLSYDALPVLDRLGIVSQLDALGAPVIGECRIVSGTRTFGFDLPAVSRGVSRFALDRVLFDGAVAAGARPFAGWTADLAEGNVVIRRAEESQKIHARVVVGAWGRWGRIDQTLRRQFVKDRRHRHFGFKRHYRNGSSTAQRIDLHSFRAGYLGVGPIEGGLTNICGLVHHSRIRGLKGGWSSFSQEIAEEQPSLRGLFESHAPEDAEFLSSEPVIFLPKSPVENGMFLLGDAAGLVDPLTGSGMAIAIQSALLAAPIIMERLAGTAGAEDAYRRKFSEFFSRRLRWSRRIAYLLSRPRLLGVALRAGPPARLGRFLTERTRADRAALDKALQEWFG